MLQWPDQLIMYEKDGSIILSYLQRSPATTIGTQSSSMIAKRVRDDQEADKRAAGVRYDLRTISYSILLIFNLCIDV